MSEQDFGVDSTLENQEEVVLETTDEDVEQEDVDWKAEAAKLKELADNQRIRAERAEKLAKAQKAQQVAPKSNTAKDFSAVDMYALIDAKVPMEDMEVVRKYASMENISIAEAVKSSIVKTILSDNLEKRTTAAAANVGTARRSSGKISDQSLLDLARSGKMPETPEDIERLNMIRRGMK